MVERIDHEIQKIKKNIFKKYSKKFFKIEKFVKNYNKLLVKKYIRKYLSGNVLGSIDLKIRREALVRKHFRKN